MFVVYLFKPFSILCPYVFYGRSPMCPSWIEVDLYVSFEGLLCWDTSRVFSFSWPVPFFSPFRSVCHNVYVSGPLSTLGTFSVLFQGSPLTDFYCNLLFQSLLVQLNYEPSVVDHPWLPGPVFDSSPPPPLVLPDSSTPLEEGVQVPSLSWGPCPGVQKGHGSLSLSVLSVTIGTVSLETL